MVQSTTSLYIKMYMPSVVSKIVEVNMVLGLIIVCLVLALTAGAVEVCIASYCIRRAKRADSKVRSLNEQVMNYSERLKDHEHRYAQLCADTIKYTLKPNKAYILKTVKKLKGETQKKRIVDIVGYLIALRNGVNVPLDHQYLSDFIAELNSLPNNSKKQK